MITFDFINPYIIYVIYVSFTFFSLFFILKYPYKLKPYEKKIGIFVWFVLVYSQVIRYGIPYLAGNPTMPFYLSRIASIVVILFLIFGNKKWYGFVFFITSTSIFPVLIPAGPIETIRVHNESFFIDHYVVALFPFYLLSVKRYLPKRKDALIALSFLAVIIFSFIPINASLGWGYFFMNRHNALLVVFPNMPWVVFASLFVTGIGIWYFLMSRFGRSYLKSREE